MTIQNKPKSKLDLRKMVHFIFGHPKCGKSTLASQFPGACFLATERGLDHLSATRWENKDGDYVVKTWEEVTEATKEIIESKLYTSIILDTIGNLCVLADEYVCRKGGEEFRNDGKLSYGKGAAMVVSLLRRYFAHVSSYGMGVIMIAHSTSKTLDTRTGKIEKTIAMIPGDNKAGDLLTALLGMADTILFLDSEPNGTRVIRTKPAATFDAGDRTGTLPAIINLPADTSANDFATLYEAFYGVKFGAAKEEKVVTA